MGKLYKYNDFSLSVIAVKVYSPIIRSSGKSH